MITEGDGGWGSAPRSNMVQKEDGTIMFLVIDGRQTKDISRRVYRMKSIDWDYVASPSVNKSGKSNLQLALEGGVHFTKDNHKIELHHLTQKEPGAMVEIPANKHDEFTKVLNGLVETGENFRNDKELYKQYNNFRNNYWKMREKEHLEGK